MHGSDPRRFRPSGFHHRDCENQFVSLFTYQANAVLNSDVDESEKEALQTDLENYSGIDELLEMYCQNIELQTDKRPWMQCLKCRKN